MAPGLRSRHAFSLAYAPITRGVAAEEATHRGRGKFFSMMAHKIRANASNLSVKYSVTSSE